MKAACGKARRTATVDQQWEAKIKSLLNTLVAVDLICPDTPLKQFFVIVTFGVVGASCVAALTMGDARRTAERLFGRARL